MPEAEDSRITLLAAPSNSEVEGQRCLSLLETGEPERARLLTVSITGNPGQRLRAYVDKHGDPADATTVCGSNADTAGLEEEGVTVKTITNPGDLTRMGIEIDKTLGKWDEEDGPIAFGFYSLTPLLQYVELQTLFKFLHVLTSRLRDVGATAHFHIDPEAHDEKTLSVLRSLFDEVEETGRAEA